MAHKNAAEVYIFCFVFGDVVYGLQYVFANYGRRRFCSGDVMVLEACSSKPFSVSVKRTTSLGLLCFCTEM